MPAPTQRATLDQLFATRDAYLRNVMWLNYAQWPEEYSVIGKLETSEKMKEVDFSIAELGMFAQKAEGAPIELDSIEPSYSKTFLHLTWARGVEITMEALEDDQDDVLGDQMAALGYAARETVETIAANEWLNNGHTTSTAMDGQPIYGTHTTAKGFVIVNTAAVDLDVPGVQTGLNYFANLRTEAGNRMRLIPAVLIVSPELSYAAHELVDSIQKPNTADNNINSLQRFNLRVFVSHYMNSSTKWFMWVGADMQKAKWYWRKRPVPVRDTRYSNQSALSGMLFRQSVGVSDYRTVWGSNP